MTAAQKRKEAPTRAQNAKKISKTKKKWWSVKSATNKVPESQYIEQGDAGIWATCERGREGKSVTELRDLFQNYAEDLYGDELSARKDGEDDETGTADIEASINDEVQGLQKPKEKPLFLNVTIDCDCLLFIKTRPPVDPVKLVHKICKDIAETGVKQVRFSRRLTPMTLMDKADEQGLDTVANNVIPPHFHGEDITPKKFAIRPTLRNHSKMKRDEVIEKVARMVGKPHTVDLHNPDLVILVDLYKNELGMSVVDGQYEKLKRYNLVEIGEPKKTEEDKKGQDKKPDENVEAGKEDDTVVKAEDGTHV